MKVRIASLATMFLAIPLALTALQQSRTIEGTWEAELNRWDGEDHIQLNLRMRLDGDRSNWGNSHEAAELPILAAALRRAGREDVSFTLTREAGRIDFTGSSDGDEANGDFTWTGSPSFLTAMAGLGYEDLSARQQFTMTVTDITLAFTRAMHDRGYDVPAEDLVKFGIFDVTPAFVDELAALGHRQVAADMLVKLQIHDVTPGFISDMNAAGYESALDDYVRFSIHDVDAEFAGAMKRTFGDAVTAEDLVRFQIHDIDANFVEQLEALGGFELDMDDVVRMAIHDVTPTFVREMGQLGYLNLSADDLVRFQIHDVSSEFVSDLAAEGYEGLSPDDLVRFQIHDVDGAFIRSLEREGHTDLTPDELVSAKIMGRVRRP